MKASELLTALDDARTRLDTALSGLDETQLQMPGAIGDWTVKDVLTHLTAWEAELVTGLARLRRGQSPGKTNYTQAEILAQNAKWHAENKDRPLDRVLADWRGARRQLVRQIEALSEADLNAPRAWLKEHTIVDWVVSWIIEHEIEHAGHLAEWAQHLKGA